MFHVLIEWPFFWKSKKKVPISVSKDFYFVGILRVGTSATDYKGFLYQPCAEKGGRKSNNLSWKNQSIGKWRDSLKTKEFAVFLTEKTNMPFLTTLFSPSALVVLGTEPNLIKITFSCKKSIQICTYHEQITITGL